MPYSTQTLPRCSTTTSSPRNRPERGVLSSRHFTLPVLNRLLALQVHVAVRGDPRDRVLQKSHNVCGVTTYNSVSGTNPPAPLQVSPSSVQLNPSPKTLEFRLRLATHPPRRGVLGELLGKLKPWRQTVGTVPVASRLPHSLHPSPSALPTTYHLQHAAPYEPPPAEQNRTLASLVSWHTPFRPSFSLFPCQSHESSRHAQPFSSRFFPFFY